MSMILVLIMMLLQLIVYQTFTFTRHSHSQFNKKAWYKKISGLIKKCIFTEMTFFSCNILVCVSVSNQESKMRPAIINSNRPSIYSYSFIVNKSSGSCNNINDPYAKLCVPDVVKHMNTKVFNLMLRNNESIYVSWHETCTCKCRL